MKKFSAVIIMTFMLSMLMASNALAISQSKVLAVKSVQQAKSNWCWAACAEMAGKYVYAYSIRDQWDVVDYVKTGCTGSYPNEAGTLRESEKGSELTLISTWIFHTRIPVYPGPV